MEKGIDNFWIWIDSLTFVQLKELEERAERFLGLDNSLTRFLHRIDLTSYEFGKVVIVMHSPFDTYIVLRKSCFLHIEGIWNIENVCENDINVEFGTGN